MTNFDIKRVCIHECCHAVVARLFRQRMTIEKVVVNADSAMNCEDNGTLYINGPRLDNDQDHTALAITLFAGVIGENMYLQGADTIRDRKDEIIADNTIIDWKYAGGDISAYNNNAYVFTLFYQIDGDKLKEFCIRFLIDFLGKDEIWSKVEQLSDELLKAIDLKLSGEGLEFAFRKIGLDGLFDNKRKEYLNKCDEVLQYCLRT